MQPGSLLMQAGVQPVFATLRLLLLPLTYILTYAFATLFCCSCSLYVTVISTIKGYGDYFWVDVVEKVDEWGEQVLQYQAQCKKLPKALRDWQAYVDCRWDM
jgi:hypothetical protein